MTQDAAVHSEVDAMAALVVRQHGWNARYFVADQVSDFTYSGDASGAAFWRMVGEAVQRLQAPVTERYTAKWV
jgi:hypothetical protein